LVYRPLVDYYTDQRIGQLYIQLLFQQIIIFLINSL